MPSGIWFTAVQHSGCIRIFMCLCSAVALLAFDCVALWKLYSALLNAAAMYIQSDKVTKARVLCNSLICPSNSSPYWLCHNPFFSLLFSNCCSNWAQLQSRQFFNASSISIDYQYPDAEFSIIVFSSLDLNWQLSLLI